MKKTLCGFTLFLVGLAMGSALSTAAVPTDSGNQKLTIIQTTEPSVRPLISEALPTYGVVRMVINVDETGKLADWMLLDYTNSRYADAAVEAVQKWQYKPAVYHGVPVGVRTTIAFNFETRGQVVSISGIDTVDAFVRRVVGERPVKCVFSAGELDDAPKPTVVVSPAPIQLPETTEHPKGVRVDFFIDETGRPRMATVDIAENDLMANASLQAIEQWRFTPPMRKGQPVAVRASQWFDFSRSLASTK